ncbi:MAG TPA: CRISPR-associated protein Csc3 [Planktothrix sp. UBA8407]|nr:CRISPR-associated protein Csc3 [Planktothrix sp. UBA8407]HBK22256.1 CRISPR-associated protein Csc3 [Planktothrix sp. UBA10369]
MSNRLRLLNRPPQSLEERYFSEIRPKLYELHGDHHQTGIRKGRTLAEHFDSACQFVLTVSKLAKIAEQKRAVLLAATAVHDLNKIDPSGRKVKQLARDKIFLQEQLEQADIVSLITSEIDLELVRCLIERHSGHNVSDGSVFLPQEDDDLERLTAILIAADLLDLGLENQEQLFRKLQTELTVALGRSSHLFRVRVSEDRGYMTALLLGACDEVLRTYGLTPLAIFPDGELFEGEIAPKQDLTKEIAASWQAKIDAVFGNNIDQLVKTTKDGIKIRTPAIQHDHQEVLTTVLALLEKKKANFKLDKVQTDINKWGKQKVEQAELDHADSVGLLPISNSDEFVLAEGLKAAYLSYRQIKPELSTHQVWEKIGVHVGFDPEQLSALEAFDAQYGRPLFAARAIQTGLDGVKAAILESLQMRKDCLQQQNGADVSEELIEAVAQTLNCPFVSGLDLSKELTAYINANPRERCSLGPTKSETEDLAEMPTGTKVQVFSNRLPGGMSSDPRRQAEPITSLAYQLMTVGANFPSVKKEPPYYLHLTLPKGSSPELLRIWRECLQNWAATNGDGGPVSVDWLKLYKENNFEFRTDKVVGFAFPKRPEFVHTTVIIPLTWGDTNSSIALLKSLRLALELSLSSEFGFPFILSSNMQVEASTNAYGQVEGIPSSLQPLLATKNYQSGHYNRQEAEVILKRLGCLGNLVQATVNLKKFDDCLYDLACAATQPFSLYYVLLRWILREQEEPNIALMWSRIREPLNTLLETLMPDENASLLTKYLKEAARIAAEAHLQGSSFKRTAQVEPFANFISQVRSQKSYMDLEFLFAALVQEYHHRLDRISDYGGTKTKLEQIKNYYSVIRKLYEEVYQARPEKLLVDQKSLEAAYLFFLEEARQQLKNKPENQPENPNA